ncbi:lysophospholipase [Psychromonas sp. psych-6C06]|uniref:alpha/beta fold hydrolase n=1 Tax=Psychromonas sp. psych-6C06 TaxID=2058089 RepID=UPI000C34339C|nr:alpha/beta fold hydrolase [Psychromonas sp. psych-6C06]PKF61307.1 lysophospholipase [Psychromonas sp. psych-6C06]
MKTYIHLLGALFMCYTSIIVANDNMQPFPFSGELTLSSNYNAEINAFWLQAQPLSFQGVDNKRLESFSLLGGNTRAIVISQGRNESVLKYKEVAFDFFRQGYDVFLLDHRGQGFSERFGGDQHRGYVNNFQDYVDDFNHYVTALELDKKYQQRYLLSHSMGGTISALYLAQYNHPFQSSVFYSPMFTINTAPLPNFMAKLIAYSSASVCSWFSDKACYVPGGKGYQKKIFENNQLTTSPRRFDASQYDFEHFPETQLGSATMRWLATSLSATEQAIEEAHNIDIPILVVQAGNDQVVNGEGQHEFFDNVTYCKFNQFLTIEDAKHEILLERDEFRTIALSHTLQFLSKTAQGKRSCIK